MVLCKIEFNYIFCVSSFVNLHLGCNDVRTNSYKRIAAHTYKMHTNQTLYSRLGRLKPGTQRTVIEFDVASAVRLYGALGTEFSIISSVSDVMVAASLEATHWYLPRSLSSMSVSYTHLDVYKRQVLHYDNKETSQ